MLVRFIYLLFLIWAFHCLFSLEFFYLALDFFKDFAVQISSEFLYLNILLLVLFVFWIGFWSFFSLSLGVAFILKALRGGFHDSSRFFFIFLFLYATIFCILYKIAYSIFFFIPKLFRYYGGKGFFNFNYFSRTFVLGHHLNSSSLANVSWLKYFEFYILKFFVNNWLYFFYLKFFLLYSFRYFSLLLLFIFLFFFHLFRNLIVTRFYVLYILIYSLYSFSYFLLSKLWLFFSQRVLFIFFINSSNLRKILGRIISYDDFTYVSSSRFMNHRLSFIYSLMVPFSLTFLWQPFHWFILRLYYFKKLILLFLNLVFFYSKNVIFYMIFRIKNFPLLAVFAAHLVSFIYLCLALILSFNYKNLLIFLLNLVSFYLTFISLLIFSIKGWSLIGYLKFFDSLSDSFLYLFFILINFLWFLLVFFCNFFLYLLKSLFYFITIFFLKFKWFLLLLILGYFSFQHPSVFSELVGFANFFYLYSGLDTLFNFFLWISPFPLLNWITYTTQISNFLTLAASEISQFSYLHSLLEKADFIYTPYGYLTYSLVYYLLSVIPFKILFFLQTPAWVWFCYYLIYWHYLFTFFFHSLLQYFFIYLPLSYYAICYFMHWVGFYVLDLFPALFSGFFISFIPISSFIWFYLWYFYYTFLNLNFYIDLKNLLIFFFHDYFIFELLCAGLSLFFYKFFYLQEFFSFASTFWLRYPFTYYDLPYYDLSMKKVELLLARRRTHASWKVWGFYSRPGFDSLAYTSPYARYRNNPYNLSPIKGLRFHSIDFSLKISDRRKIFILLNLYDHRLRAQARYSFSVLGGNNYIQNFFEFSKLNGYLDNFSDTTMLRRRKRRLSTLIPLNNVSRLQSIPVQFIFISWMVSFFFIYNFSKGFNRFTSMDTKDLYNPEATWWFYRHDYSQQYVWFISAVFLADSRLELLRFQEILNKHTQSLFDLRSFWEFFYDVKSKVNYLYNMQSKSVLVENLYAGVFYSKPISFLKSLFLSVSLLEKSGIKSDYFASISFRNLVNNSWLPIEIFAIWSNWTFVDPEKNLSFENEFPLDVLSSKKFLSFFDEKNFLVNNWDDFVMRPLGPYNSFLYYVNIFSLFYSQYNLNLYISKLNYNHWSILSETYNLSTFFQLVYHHSFPSYLDSVDVYSFSDYPFVDYFLETSSKSLIIFDNLNFFSSFYHDFIQLHKWDFYENLLVLYDSRTANISTQINIEVDLEDHVEEEDETFSDVDSFEYYYLTYLDLDIRAADPIYWQLQDSQTKKLAGKWVVFPFFYKNSLWVDELIKLGDIEEYIPEYLPEARPEFEIWDYTEDVGDANLTKSYYNYELGALDTLKLYFVWLDSKIFNFALPWWSFHKDYLYFSFRDYNTFFGRQYLDNNDLSEIFPFFFYWFFTFLFCFIHVVIWTNYLNLVPYLKLLLGYCIWGFLINYVCYYNFFPFFGDNGVVNIYFDPEISNFIYYSSADSLLNYISFPVIDSLIADSYLSVFVYYIGSCFLTFLKFFIYYSSYIVVKLEWSFFFLFWLVVVFGFRSHVCCVFNRFIFYDSYVLFKLVYLLRLKLNSKRNFLYDSKDKV